MYFKNVIMKKILIIFDFK